MPDESVVPNQLPPSDTPAAPAGMSPLPDPQKLVDEALTTPSALPPQPPEPTAEPAPIPPEQPLTQTQPTPLSDDMPLAFAGIAPTSEPVPPTPPTTPIGSAFPPPPPAPLPPVTPMSDEPKKKKGMGKVLGVVVGLFLLIGGIAGGYWYYTTTIGKPQEVVIAAITDKSQCTGCSKDVDGGWLVWRDGQCKVTGICNSSKPSKNTENPQDPIADAKTAAACTTAQGTWCASVDSNGTSYAFCIPNTSTKGCNQEARDRGYVISVGTTYTAGACTESGKKQCVCGDGKTYCFAASNGYCGFEDGISDQTRMTGLCAITPNPLYTWADPTCTDIKNPACKAVNVGTNVELNKLAQNDGIADWFNQNGLKTTGVKNIYFCKNKFDDLIAGCSTVANVNLKCFCGTIQIDYGNGFESKTMKCGCDTKQETTTPSPSPSLACTSITKDKATPAKGDKVTFTCLGKTTNAGTPALTYQFRIRRNGGEWQTLSATDNKASYTVSDPGTYEAQCSACGVLKTGAASTCDPDWRAAQ